MIQQKTVGILSLQGDVREHAAALREVGANVATVRRASELEQIDGLVIPGGESTTMAHLLTVFELWDPLHAALRKGLPVYGSCAGMIMLARDIVDGRAGQQGLDIIDMSVRRNAFGPQTESFEEDLQLRDIAGPPFRGIFIRAPWVESVGDNVEVLASVDVGAEAHPVFVRQGAAMATSFHPEVTGDTRIHEAFLGLL